MARLQSAAVPFLAPGGASDRSAAATPLKWGSLLVFHGQVGANLMKSHPQDRSAPIENAISAKILNMNSLSLQRVYRLMMRARRAFAPKRNDDLHGLGAISVFRDGLGAISVFCGGFYLWIAGCTRGQDRLRHRVPSVAT
jgi:hypothetical protein